MRNRPYSLHSRHTTLIMAVALVGLFVFGLAFFADAKSAFVSSEVKFADVSPSGLAIMPASCPSDPHWAGECSAPAGGCTIEVSPTSIPSGGGTLQLVWTTGAYDQNYYTAGGTISTLGAVFPYGSLTIGAPNVTTTYTYNGNYYNINGTPVSSYSCSATVTVTATPPTYSLYIGKQELNRNPGDPVSPGDIIAYRMYVGNDGTRNQTWLDVHDHIPTYTTLVWQGGGTDYNSCGQIAGCVDGNGDIWWQQQYAPAGWSGYVDFNVQVNANAPNGAQICNTARITSRQRIIPKDSNPPICNPIVSCPTNLPLAPANPQARAAWNASWGGMSGKRIDTSAVNAQAICVTNNSQDANYFVPNRTQYELDQFKTHLPPGANYYNL